MGEEKTSSYILHVHFLRQVVQRSKTFKDELLASCLKLLLASPKPLISIATLVEPICLALSLGLSYLPLASDALAAVKMWIREYRGGKQERKLLSDCLELVIPYFKDYLMLAPEASSTTGSGGVGDGGGGGSSVSSSSTSKKTHFARMMGSVYHTSDPFIHVQVRQLQMDIMRMLGSISGGDARHIMLVKIQNCFKELFAHHIYFSI